jgi:hypothetical protein
MSPHIKNLVVGLYKYFKVSSSFLRNLLKSPVGALDMLKTINLDAPVYSSPAQISKSFSLQFCKISILLTFRSLRIKIHTPPLCRCLWEKLDPSLYPDNVK